ncbi:hypothetical protein ACFL60_04945 [Candidatus Omnitrophota bacterium]
MKKITLCICIFLICFAGCGQNTQQPQPPHIVTNVPGVVYKNGPVKGRMIEAGFYEGDSTFHGVMQASDGNVYYVICAHYIETNAKIYRYNPRTGEVTMIGDLNQLVGEDGKKVYPQGKVHTRIFEHNGKLYFATHCGSYKRGGSEQRGPYPGGHFMSYDLASGEFEDYGIGAPEEGLLTMNMDKKRGRMYSITWPSMLFVYYDLTSGKIKSFGKSVVTPGFETIDELKKLSGPRSLALDPRTGNVYWCHFDGSIACYDYEKDSIETLDEPRVDRPVLMVPEGNDSGQNITWRSVRWSESLQKFYGIYHYTEYLFSFDPMSGEMELLDRLTPAPTKKSGETLFGSLAFELSPDGKTVYYTARGARITLPDKPGTILQTNVVTYDIPLRRYTDHGPIELDDGRFPFSDRSLYVGKNGKLYIAGWIPFDDQESEKGKTIIKARYSRTSQEKLEEDGITEVNLMEIDNPLE